MAPETKKTINHFTHPAHPLAELCSETEYLCNGCHTPGVGTRYSCHSCNFNLHDYCASCPISLSSFMHPHPLALVARKPRAACQNHRHCNLCGDSVLGLFYRCKDCDFDVHPLCTQLPELLRHALDPAHPLRLQHPSSTPSCCAVCGAHCNTRWRYSCGACGLHIHLECVLAPGGPPTSQRSPRPAPPPPYGYGYGVPPQHAYGPYNMYGNVNYNLQAAQGGGATNGRLGKRMFSVVGKLAMGVLSNVIFGMANLDFPS